MDGISVLMSVYEKENPIYLREAFESIYNQTKKPDQVVLIEDGPLTEQLLAIIDDYAGLEIEMSIYQFEKNVQLGRALAKGVQLCKYDYIARMDTDDIAMRRRLELQYQFLKMHPKIAAVGGTIEEFSDDGEYHREKKMPCDAENVGQYARYRNPINHMTVMMRKSAVLAVGNYEHFPFLEDYYLWSRMLAKGMLLENLPEVLVRARTNPSIYKRRGGIDYFRRYHELRKLQKRMGLLNTKEYLYALVLTAGITLQPSWLRRVIYRKYLR